MKLRNPDLQEKRVVVQNIRTTYKIIGDGQPVLILHGWGGSSDSWKAFLEHHSMKRSFSLISLDLPGFGKTNDPPIVWNLSDYVQFVLDFIHVLGLSNVIIVGHSFGGRIAIKLAARFSENIDAIILVAAAGIKHPKNIKQKIAYIVAKQGKKVLSSSFIKRYESFFRKSLYRVIGERDYLNTKGVMKQTFQNVIGEDLTSLLESIILPTLVIWGTKDSYVPLSDAYLIHNKIHGSVLEVIHGAGHGVHLEMPGRLYKLITHFIAK